MSAFASFIPEEAEETGGIELSSFVPAPGGVRELLAREGQAQASRSVKTP